VVCFSFKLVWAGQGQGLAACLCACTILQVAGTCDMSLSHGDCIGFARLSVDWEQLRPAEARAGPGGPLNSWPSRG
jgi:hypothetical protein